MTKLHTYTDSLPKVPCNLFEGIRTEYTGQGDDGGEVTIGVYNQELSKGDLVKLRDHTTNELVLVEKAAAGDNTIIGQLIDDPIGEDTVTASAATPATAYQRIGTVAMFGMGVITLTASATGAVSPGDSLGLDADEANEVEQEVAYTSVDESDSGNAFTAISYAAAGSPIAVLIGAATDVTN